MTYIAIYPQHIEKAEMTPWLETIYSLLKCKNVKLIDCEGITKESKDFIQSNFNIGYEKISNSFLKDDAPKVILHTCTPKYLNINNFKYNNYFNICFLFDLTKDNLKNEIKNIKEKNISYVITDILPNIFESYLPSEEVIFLQRRIIFFLPKIKAYNLQNNSKYKEKVLVVKHRIDEGIVSKQIFDYRILSKIPDIRVVDLNKIRTSEWFKSTNPSNNCKKIVSDVDIPSLTSYLQALSITKKLSFININKNNKQSFIRDYCIISYGVNKFSVEDNSEGKLRDIYKLLFDTNTIDADSSKITKDENIDYLKEYLIHLQNQDIIKNYIKDNKDNNVLIVNNFLNSLYNNNCKGKKVKCFAFLEIEFYLKRYYASNNFYINTKFLKFLVENDIHSDNAHLIVQSLIIINLKSKQDYYSFNFLKLLVYLNFEYFEISCEKIIKSKKFNSYHVRLQQDITAVIFFYKHDKAIFAKLLEFIEKNHFYPRYSIRVKLLCNNISDFNETLKEISQSSNKSIAAEAVMLVLSTNSNINPNSLNEMLKTCETEIQDNNHSATTYAATLIIETLLHGKEGYHKVNSSIEDSKYSPYRYNYLSQEIIFLLVVHEHYSIAEEVLDLTHNAKNSESISFYDFIWLITFNLLLNRLTEVEYLISSNFNILKKYNWDGNKSIYMNSFCIYFILKLCNFSNGAEICNFVMSEIKIPLHDNLLKSTIAKSRNVKPSKTLIEFADSLNKKVLTFQI